MKVSVVLRILVAAMLMSGLFAGAQEDCVGFNPATTEAKLVSGNWKIVDGRHWIMDFGSNRAEAEKAERIIKHYRMTEQCFVGRPNAPMTYFKTRDGVPVGPFPGEDAIRFDPARVEARRMGGTWKVMQGAMAMLDFGGSEANARRAARIIQENGFQYQCFVGRPHAPMMYFRKDVTAAPVVETSREDCIPFDPDRVEAKRVGGNWKVVQGGIWMLDFGSNRAEAERAERIIKHYRMTEQCFVGRPNAPMMYFKTRDGVPEGPFPGEDAIKFDPARVEAREVNGHWKVGQRDMWMLDFGASRANARKAVQIIQENEFKYQCFVGRPNAPMMYFRRGKESAPSPAEVTGEDCVSFNPATTEARRVGGNWKIVDGNHWILDFGSNQADAERAERIIKHYRMTEQCFVGRPNAAMTYFKTRDGVPVGPFPGEDAIKFDPARVEAREVSGHWKVVQGDMWMLDFGDSEANARRAVRIIHENGFRYQCFVGRPNAPMMYFRKDAEPRGKASPIPRTLGIPSNGPDHDSNQ